MIPLLRTQLVASLGLSALFVGKKRVKSFLMLGLFLACMTPAYSGYVFVLVVTNSYLTQNQMPYHNLVLAGFYNLAVLMTLFSGLPVVYSSLFQRNDLSILLPLPYRPGQLVVAKLLVCYVTEGIFSAAVFVPALIVNYLYTSPSLLVVVNRLICLLLLPVAPLAICAILCVLISNIPGIGRNKWFWYTVIISGMLAMWISYMNFVSSAPGMGAEKAIMPKLQQMKYLSGLLPGTIFGVRAMAQTGASAVYNQAMNILVAASLAAAAYYISERLYMQPVLAGGAVRRVSRNRTAGAVAGRFWATYVRKELASVLKDPTLAMNALAGYVMFPLMFVIASVQSSSKAHATHSLLQVAKSPGAAQYMPIVVIGIGLALAFVGCSSSLFSAAYSKDGKRLWVEKSLPILPRQIMLGKLAAGMLILSVPNLALIIVIAVALSLTLGQALLAFSISEIIIAYLGLFGLGIDCRRPKIHWKDTAHVVKQNLNVFLTTIVGFAVFGANIALMFVLWGVGVRGWALNSAILTVNIAMLGLAWIWARTSDKHLERLAV